MARDCLKRSDPKGRKSEGASSKQITASQAEDLDADQSSILQLLFSDSDEDSGNVDMVQVSDKPRCAQVDIHGVPAYGVIDSGSDVTIMGGELLRKVAAVAKLRKKNLKPPDRYPQSYDQRPFKLHGRMDLRSYLQDKR